MLTWTLLDVLYFKKPAILGSVQGMITGLVAITPAAGVIAGWAAIIMGVLSGSIPWLSMNMLGRTRLFQRVDDTLGVFHTHMVAGFIGGFFTGIFATIDGSASFGISNPGGAIFNNGRQVWVQIVGFLFIVGWNLAVTPLILFFIRYVCRIPLRMTEEQLLIGDDAIHGEAAYEFESLPGVDRDQETIRATNGHPSGNGTGNGTASGSGLDSEARFKAHENKAERISEVV